MNIQNLKTFLEILFETMNINGDEGLSYFRTEWPKFDDDERTILKNTIAVKAINETTSEAVDLEIVLYWMAIAINSEKEVIDGKIREDDIFQRLVLGDGVNGNQIVKIFRDLKMNGDIQSSYDLIAEAISIIFPIEYSTAYKDLTQGKRLLKVKDLLK